MEWKRIRVWRLDFQTFENKGHPTASVGLEIAYLVRDSHQSGGCGNFQLCCWEWDGSVLHQLRPQAGRRRPRKCPDQTIVTAIATRLNSAACLGSFRASAGTPPVALHAVRVTRLLRRAEPRAERVRQAEVKAGHLAGRLPNSFCLRVPQGAPETEAAATRALGWAHRPLHTANQLIRLAEVASPHS